MLSYYLFKILSWLICMLPLSIRRALGNMLGRLMWLVVPGWRKQMAVDNIIACLGESVERAEQIAKHSVCRFGHMLVEELYFPNINKHNIGKLIKFKGEEYLREAHQLGRGVVFATAHYGNWELTATAVVLSGYPEVSVGKRQTNKGVDRFIHEYREMHGAKMLYKTNVREMARLLGAGHCIGLLMDQDAGPGGLPVNFLGKPSFAPAGPAALARMSDAPIVPIISYALEDGTYIQEFFPAVYVEKTLERDKDILNTTKQLMAFIEREIRLRPHEWFWIHNRWRLNKD